MLRSEEDILKRKNKFIENAIKVHGDVYKYNHVTFINVDTKVDI